MGVLPRPLRFPATLSPGVWQEQLPRDETLRGRKTVCVHSQGPHPLHCVPSSAADSPRDLGKVRCSVTGGLICLAWSRMQRCLGVWVGGELYGNAAVVLEISGVASPGKLCQSGYPSS
ncbi:ribosome biogenesis protein BOP1 [Platysternon megacephalum]|uniref:Ribosome biogenesis protein BOP1 n=1 Tax=Platysternon megacephalum TaxID=55544 RepID=A0A4D9DZL8_9SAUR|nr:ribosome biogenesis protein BOP1 [Platysternon megacephalum]